MALKVALSGAHGTGKTTLIRLIEARWDGARVLPEVPRVLLGLFENPEELRRDNNTFARQLSIVAAQMGYEAESGEGTAPLFTDRTVADHWAYTLVLFPGESASPEGRLVAAAVERWLATYDRVFFLHPEFFPEDDGVRESDVAFQMEIHETLLGIYERASVPIMRLQGTPEERLAQLIQNLEDRS